MPEQIDVNNPPLADQPAFPVTSHHIAGHGLSKREYFFAIAFHALLTRPLNERLEMVKNYGMYAIAKCALSAADNAIKVLEEA